MEATMNSALPQKSTNVHSERDNKAQAAKAQLELWRRRLKMAERVSNALAARVAVELFTSTRRHRRPERERELLETGTRLPVSSEFVTWSFGEGPTVLLVHGWEGRGAQLGAFVEPLVAAGFRVVTFDAPAHGDSPGRSITLSGFIEAMLKIKWHVGDIHAVVAHSFGAAAVCTALRRGLAPKGVVFIAPVAALERGFTQFSELMQLEPRTLLAMRKILETRTGRRLDDANPLLIAREISIPLVIFHDRKDRDVPWEDGLKISRAWPSATLQLTSGLGHNRILRDPEVVASAVEFIKGAASEEPELERRLSASGL